MEQIRRVVGDNFAYFSMLWVLIRIANCLAEAILMSTHNICFYGDWRKLSLNNHQIPSLSFPLFDLGLHCLPFGCITILYSKTTLFEFKNNYSNFLGVWIFCNFMVSLIMVKYSVSDTLKYRSNEVDVALVKNVNKVEKWQKLTAGLNPNHMHIFKLWTKRCAKLNKDRHEVV